MNKHTQRRAKSIKSNKQSKINKTKKHAPTARTLRCEDRMKPLIAQETNQKINKTNQTNKLHCAIKITTRTDSAHAQVRGQDGADGCAARAVVAHHKVLGETIISLKKKIKIKKSDEM